MQIPKYIEKALEQRVKAAEKFNEADYIVSTYLDKMGIEADMWNTYSGANAIVNPDESAERIREAILNHKK